MAVPFAHMAEQSSEKGKQSRAQQADPVEPAAEAPVSEEPSAERYTVAGWRERARTRFGVSPHAVSGALYDAGPEDLFAEAQVRQRVDQFLKAEIK